MAMSWMGQRAPDVDAWHRDVCEWTLVEEAHMKLSHRYDKLQEDLSEWR